MMQEMLSLGLSAAHGNAQARRRTHTAGSRDVLGRVLAILDLGFDEAKLTCS